MSKDIEEPSYEVIRRLDDVELRAYAPVIQAVTDVEGELDSAQREGFRRLAGYIFGGNRGRRSIEMTAPVSTEPMKIAMTAPVSTTPNADNTHRVAFTMPAQWTLETLPAPDDARVTLLSRPSRQIAVLCFSGLAGEGRFKRERDKLLATLSHAGISTQGSPSLSRYDPPWTLPCLRRNEVQVEIVSAT